MTLHREISMCAQKSAECVLWPTFFPLTLPQSHCSKSNSLFVTYKGILRYIRVTSSFLPGDPCASKYLSHPWFCELRYLFLFGFLVYKATKFRHFPGSPSTWRTPFFVHQLSTNGHTIQKQVELLFSFQNSPLLILQVYKKLYKSCFFKWVSSWASLVVWRAFLYTVQRRTGVKMTEEEFLIKVDQKSSGIFNSASWSFQQMFKKTN